MSAPEVDELLRGALAAEAELTAALRRALESGDDAALRRAVRRYLGMEADAEGDRAPARVDGGAGRT